MSELAIQVAAILDGGIFEELDFEAVLDGRDSEAFESEWLKAHERMEALVDPADRPAIDAIRELAYKRTFAATHEPEMAAAVSDDFGLIAAAFHVGSENGWVNSLWWEYKSGRFPAGPLAPRPGSIRDL